MHGMRGKAANENGDGMEGPFVERVACVESGFRAFSMGVLNFKTLFCHISRKIYFYGACI